MKVNLDPTLFESGCSNVLDLLALLHLGFEGRHLMAPEPPEDPRVESWLGDRGALEAQECRLAFENGVREQTRTSFALTVRVTPDVGPVRLQGAELVLSLQDALACLRSPFRVLVENQVADRRFLLAMARPEWKQRLLDMERMGWLRFEHGGGIDQMQQTVNAAANSLAQGARLWVMFDSDALFPSIPSQRVSALIRTCQRHVRFHCLERRSIESYIPSMALAHWAEYTGGDRDQKITRFRALRSMADAQRWHYNMKHGFHGDRRRDDLSNVGNLYNGLVDSTRAALELGFGGNISDVFEWHTWSN